MTSPLGRPPAVPGSPDPLACRFLCGDAQALTAAGTLPIQLSGVAHALPEQTSLKGLLVSVIKQ